MRLYPEAVRALVDTALEEYFPAADTYPEILYQSMRYSLLAGGKRFRPVLTILAAGVFGAAPDSVLPCACGIEYIHTYSLIHDDLPAVDNDDLRRGLPTNHKKFGEDIAIMAGDALFAEAFSLISRLQTASDQRKIIEVIREIAAASGPGGMVGGQVVDMASTGKPISLETLRFIHARKTGRLITAAARCGAILGGATDEELDAVTSYGTHLGLAFQITDDILDETGSVEELGKTPGQDQTLHKATYPALVGLDESRRLARAEAKAATAAVDKMSGNTGALRDLAEFVTERTG